MNRRIAACLAWVMGVAALCLLTFPSHACADRLPAEGAFNRMSIEYTISGVSIDTTQDIYPNERVITGRITGGRLEVSGSVEAGAGWQARVTVSVSAGANTDSYSAESPPNEHGLIYDPWAESFSAGVDVPEGASGVVTIVVTNSIPGLSVSGSFEGNGGSAGVTTTSIGSTSAGSVDADSINAAGPDADTKVPGPARWWEWLAGTLVPGLAAGGLSLAGGLFGGGGASSPPQPGPPGGAPSPPRVLHGQEALEWLRRRGLVTQTPDGRWVKIGDWNNATAPGSGMKGYVEGTQSIPGGVDTEMVIFVEGGPAPAPPAGPGAYGAGAAALPGPADSGGGPGPHEVGGGTGPGPDRTPQPPDVAPAEGAEPPPAPVDPEGPSVGDKPSTESGARQEPDTGEGAEDAEQASDEKATDEPSPQFAPDSRRAVDDANEALTEIKASVGRITDTIGSAKDALDDIVDKADQLGLTDEHKAVVEGLVDRIRKPLEEFQENLEDKLEPLTEGIESTQESYEEIKGLLERTDRVVKVYKDIYENLPDHLDERSKVAISSYAAAFQAAGETIDHQIRAIPGIGPQIADALQKGGISPVDVGTESGKALVTAVKNVTAHEARVQDAVDPILQKLEDGLTRVEDLSQDEQGILAMSGRDPYKLRDQAIKSQEMKWAIERGDMDYIKRNDPALYEKMEKARKESDHPPPGTYEEPSALTRTLGRIINLID